MGNSLDYAGKANLRKNDDNVLMNMHALKYDSFCKICNDFVFFTFSVSLSTLIFSTSTKEMLQEMKEASSK